MANQFLAKQVSILNSYLDKKEALQVLTDNEKSFKEDCINSFLDGCKNLRTFSYKDLYNKLSKVIYHDISNDSLQEILNIAKANNYKNIAIVRDSLYISLVTSSQRSNKSKRVIKIRFAIFKEEVLNDPTYYKNGRIVSGMKEALMNTGCMLPAFSEVFIEILPSIIVKDLNYDYDLLDVELSSNDHYKDLIKPDYRDLDI